MFGLSTREVLTKAIINACRNYKESYKTAIYKNIEELNCCEEESAQQILETIRKEYLDNVANSVINTFQVSSPKIFARIQLALLSPKLCGYDIKIENGIMAGSLFAICFYAIKDSVATPRDCVKLNHIQNDIMNEVLYEIDSEMSN